ncbi:FGGY-family carbohydrate kinase [Scopulibacillus cellulosilyticus]|uniref:FGGY-family carbohydrate kinase n=1 Tax=Scopulibacillus cellulosilyticus TaxID=2665665 RepID=A0ABW2Q1H7_9BACL
MQQEVFIGIDIGSQGVRTAALGEDGSLIEQTEANFKLTRESRQEQSPEIWWQTTQALLKKLIYQCRQKGMMIDSIKALTVTSTSGTVIPLDSTGEPLHPAMMYSDTRPAEEANLCRQAAIENNSDGYQSFNASSGLPKILWYVRHYPEKAERIAGWAHAADFIINKFRGEPGVTDETNALKTGYDLINKQWPDYIFTRLGLPRDWFPNVLPSGTPLGAVSPKIAKEIGLPEKAIVTTGMTDGCASQVSSGAVHLGGWNTTIGTTLVVKGVTKGYIDDPEGRLYSHRHPQGYWMPGGASNTGADWITREYEGANLRQLDEEANKFTPTGQIAYPLYGAGERFPFISTEARGFAPQNLSAAELYTAKMEGVSYIERMAYDLIQRLSGETIEAVYTAGGASNSNTWMQIRANVLNKPIIKMRYVTGAVGAAILAASQTCYNSLETAGMELTQIEKKVEPNQFKSDYEAGYQRFLQELEDRQYIKGV